MYKCLSSLMHLYINSQEGDAREGISHDEHTRRHFVFFAAFGAALEYMYEYPQQAVKLIKEYRVLLAPEGARAATDQTMAFINEQLYPAPVPTVNIDKLADLAEQYKTREETATFPLKPLFVDGELVWELKDEPSTN